MSGPHNCQGKNFHGAVEVLHTELRGTEKYIVAYCDDCEQELTAWVDFSHADAYFEANEVADK